MSDLEGAGPPAGAGDADDLAARLVHLRDLLDEVLGILVAAPVLDDSDADSDAAPALDAGTVAGQSPATVDDYRFARSLVSHLITGLAGLTPEERERLELNGDLPQFAFHLEEELTAQREQLDPAVLARSLTFLKRHIVRLRAEYVEHQHLGLASDDAGVLLSLARHVRRRFFDELASRYAAVGYRRPYVDKFYRDYSLKGIPDGLLLRLADVAAAGTYDRYVCVLKGGMSFTTMLEAFGVPRERIVHVMAGRASGSHYEGDYLFEPLDFDPADLAGRSVLLVENNLATGATLAELAQAVAAYRPARVGVFLDYILTDLAGIDPANLVDKVGYPFAEVICGPFPARVADAAERVAALRAALIARLGAR